MATKAERDRKWRQDNAEYLRAYHSATYRRTRMRKYALQAVRTAEVRANKAGAPFSIDAEGIVLLMQEQSVCAISGIPFRDTVEPGVPHPYSPSLDRIWPEVGYVYGNLRFILNGLNALKGRGTDEDLLNICRAVVERNPDSV